MSRRHGEPAPSEEIEGLYGPLDYGCPAADWCDYAYDYECPFEHGLREEES
jgi:hypothetical protein